MEHPSEYCDCPNCCANRKEVNAYRDLCRSSKKAAGFVEHNEHPEIKGNRFLTIGELTRGILHEQAWNRDHPEYQTPPEPKYTKRPCMGWWADETRRRFA